LHHQQGDDEGDDGDEAPGRLERGEFVVESGDHHEPDAVEQRCEREQGAVGTSGHETDDDMSAQQQAHEDRDEEHDSRGDLGIRAEGGDRVGGAGDQHSHHHEGQLRGATAPRER
jgi:hypothetical protein